MRYACVPFVTSETDNSPSSPFSDWQQWPTSLFPLDLKEGDFLTAKGWTSGKTKEQTIYRIKSITSHTLSSITVQMRAVQGSIDSSPALFPYVINEASSLYPFYHHRPS